MQVATASDIQLISTNFNYHCIHLKHKGSVCYVTLNWEDTLISSILITWFISFTCKNLAY